MPLLLNQLFQESGYSYGPYSTYYYIGIPSFVNKSIDINHDVIDLFFIAAGYMRNGFNYTKVL